MRDNGFLASYLLCALSARPWARPSNFNMICF
jgi:hypothetical protein